MKGILIFLFANILFVASVKGQTLITKDAMNSFAKFTISKDLKDLEAARKLIDDAYKTKSDSNAFRNNLIRSLVYSTLARQDSALKYTYVKDPVEETLHSLRYVEGTKSAKEFKSEIKYVHEQLKYTYLYRANSSFKERRFTDALKYFTILDSIDNGNYQITHNLALLYQEVGNYEKSAVFYEKLISQKPKPEYFLTLSNLYESMNNEASNIKVLKNGSEAYPRNRDLVFKLINILGSKNDYSEIVKYIEPALKLDESNINLTYLAGFSNEMTGNTGKAEAYYKEVLNINPNNYEGNYALGLLYLNLYLRGKDKNSLLQDSKYYLSKANEIDPNELKSLTSLAILYKHTGDSYELQRVNNRINQLKLN